MTIETRQPPKPPRDPGIPEPGITNREIAFIVAIVIAIFVAVGIAEWIW